MADMMTFEQFQEFQKFQELKDKMKDSQNDNTPYLAVTSDDELHVIGDPNETEIVPADYTVYFLFPDTQKYRERVARTGAVETDEINGHKIEGEIPKGQFLAKRTYSNVHITPRRVGSVISAFVTVEQFFYDVSEDGEIKDMSYEESIEVFRMLTQDILDAVYDVVSAVLKIPADEQEWILPINALEIATKMVVQNPDVVNNADLFFGSSSSEA